MKLKYFKEDDILVIQFSKRAVDDSFEVDSAILEVDKKGEPVNLEILHASDFFKKQKEVLPLETKRSFLQ